MPYIREWTEPDLIFKDEAKGIFVYSTYYDDDYEDENYKLVRIYDDYVTDSYQEEEEYIDEFFLTEAVKYTSFPIPLDIYRVDRQALIKELVDRGHITSEGFFEESQAEDKEV